jgi:hypothetical protein
MGALSETSNDHALCCMFNHGNTLVQLLHSISLSCQLESTLPPTAQLLLSQTQKDYLVGRHLQLLNVLVRISRPSCEPLYATNTFHHEQETFLYEYPLYWVFFAYKNCTRERCSLVVHSQARSPFWQLKPASEHAHAHLLPRLSWSWTVLLFSDTHRKPITSIAAVLLPFVTYLLTLPHSYYFYMTLIT